MVHTTTIETGLTLAEAIGDWALDDNHPINLSDMCRCESDLEEACADYARLEIRKHETIALSCQHRDYYRPGNQPGVYL